MGSIPSSATIEKKTSCVFGSCSGYGQNKDKPSNRYKCWVHNDTKAWQKDWYPFHRKTLVVKASMAAVEQICEQWVVVIVLKYAIEVEIPINDLMVYGTRNAYQVPYSKLI